MKIKIILFSILLVSLISTQAVNKPQGKFDYDKFKSEKVSFITSELNLSPNEAEKFWPIYNEYDRKKWEISKQRRELDQLLINGITDMSDNEYIDLNNKIIQLIVDENKLIENYNESFLKILPPKKVVMLYVTEMKFRNQLLRKYRSENHNNRNIEKK